MARPPLPDAFSTIHSRGLGLAGRDSTGIPAHVGIGSLGTLDSVIPVSDVDQVRAKLGYGPLANAVAECLRAGARTVLAVPADIGTNGANGDVTSSKTGDGTVVASGNPNDAYDILIEILTEGVLNAATFRYSLDGGNNWSREITVPVGGAYVIPNTGVTATFACSTGFDAGDKYSWQTTQPVMSTTTAQDAIDALLASDSSFGLVHLVGPSSSAMWTVLDTLAVKAAGGHRHIHIVAEADVQAADETLDQWRDGLIAEQAGFASDYVQVVSAMWVIADPITGQLRGRNLAAIFVGWTVAGQKVSDSPAHVERGPVPMVRGGMKYAVPKDLTYADIVALDAARYVTFRMFEDLDGVYATADPMMSAETSDFRYAHLRRVMNKAAREVRLAVLPHVWGDADAIGQRAVVTSGKRPLQRMKDAGEIADYAVLIPAGQDVLGTGQLTVKIRIQPKPKSPWIETDLGFVNPYASAA